MLGRFVLVALAHLVVSFRLLVLTQDEVSASHVKFLVLIIVDSHFYGHWLMPGLSSNYKFWYYLHVQRRGVLEKSARWQLEDWKDTRLHHLRPKD